MKKLGFSIFPGWKEIKEEQIKLVKTAKNYGFTEIFFGIGPGTHWKTSISESYEIAKEILKEADEYYTFVDINPEILRTLNASPQDLSKLLIFKGVRADYGFTKEQIVEMARQTIVELNPFEITEEEVDYILKHVNPDRIKATHNYYPVFYTGISKEIFEEKTKIFKERGIEIGAFISNPKFYLRTTLEMLRFTDPFTSTSFLSKFVDRILMGDPIPEEKWLKDVYEASKGNRVRIKIYDERAKKLFTVLFTVEKIRDHAIVCRPKEKVEVEIPKSYTKIYKNCVTLFGNEVWIFTKDLGVGPFTLIGEIDDINLEILRMSEIVEFKIE